MPAPGNSAIGQTYNALQHTVVQGDPQALQQAVDQSSGRGMVVLMGGVITLISVSSVIETGTFFGILLPSDIILSASTIVFISTEKWLMVAIVAILSVVFTIAGDMLGYNTGKKIGDKFYDKEDTRYFKKSYFLKAQESLLNNGDKMLFIGRYLSIGGFLPTLCGVMRMDFNKFLQLSILSATMWKMSLVIPIVIIMFIFPDIKIGILLVLIFTIPEVIGWIVLLKPSKELVQEKIIAAKQQINSIRQSVTDEMTVVVQQVEDMAQRGQNYANETIQSAKETMASAQEMAQSIQSDVSSMMQHTSPSPVPVVNTITSSDPTTPSTTNDPTAIASINTPPSQ